MGFKSAYGRAAGFPVMLSTLLVLLLLALPAVALDVPALQGRVNDYAGLLSPSTRNHLESQLVRLEQAESTQIVVLTIPSLKGDSLEEFSIRVAEQWKIGQKGLDNGAILLIAKNDRKIRIEAGYGLEGKLTDLVAGRIIRNIIVPEFKTGQFDQGIVNGVNAMIAAVTGEFQGQGVPAAAPARRGGKENSSSLFFVAIMVVAFLGSANRKLGGLAGGCALPLLAFVFLGVGFPLLLLLIPLGGVAGLLLPFILLSGRRGGIGLGGGGFSSGGFSGGGGGFGGGGASGGW
jgi:uncharacterized protein